MMTILEGVLVNLVPYSAEFEAREHTWFNNASSFWANAGERNFATEAGIRRWHERSAERHDDGRRIGFGVCTKDGTPIGHFAINWADPTHRFAQLGAWIGEPDYWGGGYGTDALVLLIDYAFKWLDARKIWLETGGTNVRVQRQMEKVGFTLEGRRRLKVFMDGQWVDELMYGLLREEWPGRAAVTERLGLHARAAALQAETAPPKQGA